MSKEATVVNMPNNIGKQRKKVSSNCMWKRKQKEECCIEKKRGKRKGVQRGEENKGQ